MWVFQLTQVIDAPRKINFVLLHPWYPWLHQCHMSGLVRRTLVCNSTRLIDSGFTYSSVKDMFLVVIILALCILFSTKLYFFIWNYCMLFKWLENFQINAIPQNLLLCYYHCSFVIVILYSDTSFRLHLYPL